MGVCEDVITLLPADRISQLKPSCHVGLRMPENAPRAPGSFAQEEEMSSAGQAVKWGQVHPRNTQEEWHCFFFPLQSNFSPGHLKRQVKLYFSCDIGVDALVIMKLWARSRISHQTNNNVDLLKVFHLCFPTTSQLLEWCVYVISLVDDKVFIHSLVSCISTNKYISHCFSCDTLILLQPLIVVFMVSFVYLLVAHHCFHEILWSLYISQDLGNMALH